MKRQKKREARRTKMREYKKSKKETKTSETVQEKEARLAKERERKRASRKRASCQKQGGRKDNCTSHPTAKMRDYNNSYMQNETTEKREARLAKNEGYKKSKSGTKTSETVEQREARVAKERERELLEKELPVKSKVGKKITALHIPLKKELPIL